MKLNPKTLHELKNHSPFTIWATIGAIVSLIVIKFILNLNIELKSFEILHPIHIIASAMVSAAIFHKYKKNILQTIFVGIFSSIFIGSISDIIFPYLGGLIFNFKTTFHLPLIEEPMIILSSSIFGSTIGIFSTKTKIPHLIHVGISIFASLLYLLAYTPNFKITYFLISIIIVSISVIIPAWTSDLILPFIFLKRKVQQCYCED